MKQSLIKPLYFLKRQLLSAALLFLTLFSFGVTPARASDPRQDIPTVDPALMAQAARSDSLDFMILFEDQPDLSAAYGMDWEARGWYVYETLTAHAEENQARVRNFLDRTKVAYEFNWAANVIFVEGASNAALNGLLDYTEIETMQVVSNVTLMISDHVFTEIITTQTLSAESNLQQINVDDAWALGYTGTGMVVGSIDTGVLYTHAALVNQYRGNQDGGSFDHNYNWWDAVNSTTTPVDFHGHGSHTTGIMIGDDGGSNQIGVAPGAKWIACNAFTSNSASSTDLIECGQFMLAPWDLTKSNANPNLRPHVVNNSWGDCVNSYHSFYRNVVNAWQAAGIYPVFANGNASNCGYSSPPGLNTVGNPARYGNVTGVGSTGKNNGLYASHSNWGPTDNQDTINPSGYPKMKPQVVAPGISIRSAVNSGNTAYATSSGTSMSAPHAAGQVAMMWQAAPCLVGNYALTETLIERTATPINYNDGSSETPGHPNYATGWGEINVLASVFEARNHCGDSYLSGSILNFETSNPISHVNLTVIASNDSFDDRSGKSDQNGNYQIKVYSGETFSITTHHLLYEPATISEVNVSLSVRDAINDFYLVEIVAYKTFLPLIIR